MNESRAALASFLLASALIFGACAGSADDDATPDPAQIEVETQDPAPELKAETQDPAAEPLPTELNVEIQDPPPEPAPAELTVEIQDPPPEELPTERPANP